MAKKIFCIVLLVVSLVGVLSSCSETTESETEFEVQFIVDNEVYEAVSTNGNSTISMPKDPTKAGVDFKGWYFDKGVWERPFTANSIVGLSLTGNIEVYALFEESDGVGNGNAGNGGEGNNNTNTVTIRFNTMGGSGVAMQTIPCGNKATEPDFPIYSGRAFLGWYADEKCTSLFSFDTPIYQNIVLYAKWSTSDVSNLATVDNFEDIVSIENDCSLYDIFKDDEKGRIYVVYKLGVMRNVILGRVSDTMYHTGPGISYSWGENSQYEESITQSISESISLALKTSFEYSIGYEAFGASSSAKLGVSTSIEHSLNLGYSKTNSLMQANSKGGSISLDAYQTGCHYGYFVVGDQEIFQCFTYDFNGNLIEEETTITGSEISSGLRLLSSESTSFTYSDIPTLEYLSKPDFSMIFASGDGTVSNPYSVENPGQLFAIGLYPDSNYILTADIDLSKFNTWVPIGVNSTKPFSGTLEGDNKTIKNLKLTYPGTSLNEEKVCGLFGYVSGTIKNLKLEKFSFEYSSNHDGSGWVYMGALCGKLIGNAVNIEASECYVAVHRDASNCGIISAYTTGKISNSQVKLSTIVSNGDGGLICGSAKGAYISNNTVSECELNYYAVKENRSNGGIVGYAESSTVENCNVVKTKFALTGSGSDMHSYFFGGHHYCKLQPSMGYIVGTSVSSNINPDSHTVSGNTVEIASGDSLVGDNSKNESANWFKAYGGKAGTVR